MTRVVARESHPGIGANAAVSIRRVDPTHGNVMACVRYDGRAHDASRDFAALLGRVGAGAEIVIEGVHPLLLYCA